MMAVAAMGLVPMSPVTKVTPVVAMPDLVRSANHPAVPRSTARRDEVVVVCALVMVTHARSSVTLLPRGEWVR